MNEGFNMKIRTIVNKVSDGAIVAITLEVYDKVNLLEMDLNIEYSIANIADLRIFCPQANDCLKLIIDELKARGILSIKYNGAAYSIDSFKIAER